MRISHFTCDYIHAGKLRVESYWATECILYNALAKVEHCDSTQSNLLHLHIPFLCKYINRSFQMVNKLAYMYMYSNLECHQNGAMQLELN